MQLGQTHMGNLHVEIIGAVLKVSVSKLVYTHTCACSRVHMHTRARTHTHIHTHNLLTFADLKKCEPSPSITLYLGIYPKECN